MLNLYEITIILIIHYIADFVFQSDKQAKNKSSSNKALLSHTWIYTLTWYGFLVVWSIINNHILHNKADYFGWDGKILLFLPITFICHTIQDYITSRMVKKRFDKKDFHNGFVIIGFDQLLHYIQLFLTYFLLKN